MRYTLRMLGMMLALAACAFPVRSTFATPVSLAPGSSGVGVPPGDTFAGDVGSGYSVVATYSSTVTNGAGTMVTLYADAILTSGGTMDILYQITNAASSPGPIDSLVMANYSNATVAVAGLTDTVPPAGTNFVAPTSPPNAPNVAGRSSTPGAEITMTFSATPGEDLLAGQTSAIILVETNSPSFDKDGAFTASSLAMGAGSVGFNEVPEVSSISVPEPGSLVMGVLALMVGSGVYRFRQLRRA